jgi:flagellar basal body P-ring protein FlgI
VALKELVRIAGQGRSIVRGMGIVTGLAATGDSGVEPVLARPLAALYASNGNPLPDLRDLARSKSAAIVFVWAEIPEEGARKGDRINVYVKVSHSASSLAGGMLENSPVLGPLPGQGAYGFASGLIELADPEHPTVGIVYGGLQLTEDIRMESAQGEFSLARGEFDLTVREHYRDWSTTRVIAAEINDIYGALDDEQSRSPQIARAMDDFTVRVTIPEHERGQPANFVASVLDRRISPSLLNLPPQVIASRRTGSIVATGDVEISTVAIASEDLVVTTTTPPPAPQPPGAAQAPGGAPGVDKWIAIQTAGRPSERARVQDLLQAFKQLDVPLDRQIEILSAIHRTGRLHARLIVE